MKRPSVTLVLLWQEYRAEQADGYGYSRFCDLYGEWRKTISATMRQTHLSQTHPAGERLFVDYAGDTVPVLDQITNAERPGDQECPGIRENRAVRTAHARALDAEAASFPWREQQTG
jgi:transposase